MYDAQDSFCCQGKIYPLNSKQKEGRHHLQCCKDELMNTETEFCCGGKKYRRGDSNNAACCGEELYNRDVEKCITCSGKLQVLQFYENCCGGQNIYYMKSSSCCGGFIHNEPEIVGIFKNPNVSCCDTLLMNPSTQKCCLQHYTGFKSHTIPINPRIKCCGNGHYDTSKEDCQDDKPVDIRTTGDNMEICGNELIDGSREGCCVGKLKYNKATHKCCTGDWFSVIPKDQHCCNGKGVSDSQLCCEDLVLINKNHPDDKCCFNWHKNSGESYSSTNQECIEGQVQRLRPRAKPCGADYFYPDREFCCGNKGVNFTSGYDECCDTKPFNSSTEQCCRGQISKISKDEGSCCTGDGNVYRHGDNSNPCREICSNTTTYDIMTEICCDGHVRPSSGDSAMCCGSYLIDLRRSKCCGGQFPYRKKTNKRCCGDRELFNKKLSVCKKGKIKPKDKQRRHFNDGQMLCHKSALKSFDVSVERVCTSTTAVTAEVSSVTVKRRNSFIIMKIHLNNVTGIKRGEGFASYRGPEVLLLNISVKIPTISTQQSSPFKCRSRYIKRFKKVIVFSDNTFETKSVNLGTTSKLFMAKHTEKRIRYITKGFTSEYCKRFSISH